MKAKDVFSNLIFVGKGSEEFSEMEISEDQLEASKIWRDRGKRFGERVRAVMKSKE